MAVFAVGAAAAVAAVRDGETASSGSLQDRGRVWKAHVLRGDQLQAGPVLVGHRAVWVEAGRRLLVRSLDAHGRTRTIFSTSRTPGAPKGTPWPYSVQSIAAGGGRVAFVVNVSECASAPPSNRHCVLVRSAPYGAPLDSVSLLAGRPGAIRPVETWLPPSHQRFRRSCRRPSPIDVGIADAGLVVTEWPCPPPGSGARFGERLVLRTFSGRLRRVLARDIQDSTPFVAAGAWAALMEPSPVAGQDNRVQIIRVRTGQTVRWLREPSQVGIDAVLSRSGTFAATIHGAPLSRRCGQWHWWLGELSVGHIGHPGQRVLTDKQVTSWRRGPVGVAVAGDRVAYGQATGRCLTGVRLVIAAPRGKPTPIPGLLGNQLAFDGHVAAVVRGDTVQLAEIPG